MANTGLFIRGCFIGSEVKRDKDGNITGDKVLIAAGTDAYKVSVKSGLPATLTFGGLVTLTVRPNLYNGNIYYSGDFVEDEEA